MKLAPTLAAVAGMAAVGNAHVTLNPNYGAAAGNYFKFHVKIPHGTAGKETTKIVINVPHGVTSVKPEAIHGWDIDIVERPIIPYVSQGMTVNTGPAVVTYTARCDNSGIASAPCANEDHPGIDYDHLMEIAIATKLGCDFGVDSTSAATSDATEWLGQHALWFGVEQYVSTPQTNDGNENMTDMLSWTGTASGTDPWIAAQPKPAPYIFIYSAETCVKDIEGVQTKGMRWGVDQTIIDPVMDQDPVKTKAEVIAWIEEAQLTQQEMLRVEDDLVLEIAEAAQAKANDAFLVAIVAVVVSILLLIFVVIMTFIRIGASDRFTTIMVGNGANNGAYELKDKA